MHTCIFYLFVSPLVKGGQGGALPANQEVKGVTVVNFPISFTETSRSFGIAHGDYGEGNSRPVVSNVFTNSDGTMDPTRLISTAWFTVRNNSGTTIGNSLWWLAVGK